MLTAVGAATWPSGDQVWNGHKPASTPNPNMNRGNTQVWNSLSKAPDSDNRAKPSREYVPEPMFELST